MINMKTNIFFMVVALFIAMYGASAQSNNYVWIHGLNGTADSWYVYQNAFTPNNGTRLAYRSDKSITDISKELWNTNSTLFGRNTILVGHSMGGLVARELERNHSTSIKGIITLGTGHQGAQFSKELHFGGLNQLKDKIISRINSCFSSSLVAFAFTFPGITPAAIKTAEISNYISSFLTGPIGDIAVNEIAALGFNKACTDDLQPGSTFLRTLEQRKINVPILTFASEEDRWQLARVLHCQINYKKLATDPNINIDGNFDMYGYNALNTTNNIIKIGGHTHTGFAAVLTIAGFSNPISWVAAAAHSVAAVNWYSTSAYIDNGLDYDHAVLIGAYRVDKVENKFLLVKWYEYINVPGPHDGIVSVKSQQLDKTKGNNVIWANATIKGVNHMEQRNHFRTKREFDDVLNGRTYRPDIFDKNR
jgi:pimeloyl-ACP methyl ester carboxylesterase